MDPRNLTLRLRGSRSLDELRLIARTHSNIMNALHDSVVCVVCGRLTLDDENERAKAKDLYVTASRHWLGRPVGSIGREARNIANILHAAAKLGLDPLHEVFQQLLDEAIIMSHHFEAQGAANTLWAIATLQVEELRIIDPLLEACVKTVMNMKSQELANSFWAAAKLNVECAKINSLASACIDRSHLFNAQDAANTLWAAAKLGVSNQQVIDTLITACKTCSKEMSMQNAVNSLWAVAKLGISDQRVIDSLTTACIDRIKDMTAQGAANSFWAIATLNVSTSDTVINSLAHACVDRAHLFNAQDAANSLWAAAKLGISDQRVIDSLTTACIDRIKDMTAQGAANSFWAIATLNVSTSDSVINSLAHACVDRAHLFNAQDAASTLWAAAKLGISDRQVIESLTSACTDRIKDMTAQGAANSFWAIATLNVSTSDSVINSLAHACVDRAHLFNAQDAANSLWAACVLNVKNQLITSPLAAAVSKLFSSLKRVDECQQCLQATCFGVSLSVEALNHFKSVTQTHTFPISTSASQRSVAAALNRLGLSPQLEVQIFNGVLTVDIVVELFSAGDSERKSRIAIEFDGPTHFLRPAIGSTDQRVGPMNGKSRFRNALIERSGEFVSLISVPYFEWDTVVGSNEKEEKYLLQKLILPAPVK